MTVGNSCRFLGVSKSTFGSEPYLITIGNHVTLTGDTRFITHDGGVWVLRDKYKDLDCFGKITIGNNVFVGLNSIIIPNTEVGDNVVIGAGSLVRGILESNFVYAGVPVRKVMTIEEYEKKILEKSDSTKSFDSVEKRKYLVEKFK
ncbi:acyltransferase [Acinetobacter sp. YH12157]|uniref:acyltransferase n=1 Tax=Acinetobacter sp. YH12157 TaxID=2601137 RepID=UPI001C556619